jgi:hypothetical protein
MSPGAEAGRCGCNGSQKARQAIEMAENGLANKSAREPV